MNKHDIKNVDNLSMNKLIDMNNGQIKDLGDGNENGDAVNVKQLNNLESNMGKYTKAEITKVDTSLKKYFNDHLKGYSIPQMKFCLKVSFCPIISEK